MKMYKADERDIEAAGSAMSVLNDISSGYYPKRNGDECDDTVFDEEDPAHLRKFYDLMKSTVDEAPGWPGRVIGGMCYVILYEKNEIVDPSADVLGLHPRFSATQQQRDELLEILERAVRRLEIAHANGDTIMREWIVDARAAIAKATA